LPQRHKTKLFAKSYLCVFVFWCLGGENAFPQNVVDPPSTKIITKGLKMTWPQKGAKNTKTKFQGV
jgi:hypothetical protein